MTKMPFQLKKKPEPTEKKSEPTETWVERIPGTCYEIRYYDLIYGINPENPRLIWYKPDEIPLKDYFVQGGYQSVEPTGIWEECVFDPDYEISFFYPRSLRHKTSKKILKEYFSKGYPAVNINGKIENKINLVGFQLISKQSFLSEADEDTDVAFHVSKAYALKQFPIKGKQSTHALYLVYFSKGEQTFTFQVI
jgi:hypothetical protein